MAVFAAALLAGCKSDPNSHQTLEVGPGQLSFGAEGGSDQFEIASSGPWVITPDASQPWCQVQGELTGTGTQDITVVVPAYGGVQERTALIGVATADGSTAKTVAVVQSAE